SGVRWHAPGFPPSLSLRVVQLGRGEIDELIRLVERPATGHEDRSIRKHCGAVLVAVVDHWTCRGPSPDFRVVELGSAIAVGSARDEDHAVGERGRDEVPAAVELRTG